MADKKGGDDKAPIIVIKKIKKVAGGHHGGAWKVAYADFVTAMMAFFLLMWLLNVTTKDQKKGIAEFFDPSPQVVSSTTSGAGGVMGGISVSTEGARMTDKQPITPPDQTAPSMPAKSAQDLSNEALKAETQKREEAAFDKVKKQIENEIANSDLKDLSKNLKIDMTPEGLRIQIVDQDGASMFPSGSAQPFAKTEKLLAKVGQIISKLPNQISIRGHTDAAAYTEGADYTNWELSSDRANSSRRVLLDNGITTSKIANVVGKADTDNYIKDKPLDPQNRRISIILLHDSQTKESGNVNSMDSSLKEAPEAAPRTSIPVYAPTPGKVQFP